MARMDRSGRRGLAGDAVTPRRPSGADLLAGTPEAIEYLRAMAPSAFPEGPPTPVEAAVVADAVWRHLRDHPEGVPVAWDPDDATAMRISSAYDRSGLAAAFAEARRCIDPAAPHLRVTSYHEELEEP
jgi:hypothetical protein